MAGENSPYLQFKPGSFFGGKRIDARPRNVEYEEGTGPRTGRTARRVDPGMGGGLDSFYLSQRYRDMPMSQISSFANTMRGRGMMYNPYSDTYQNDSMYNRSGYGYGREPQGEMPQGGMPQGPQPPNMTEPQMEWARLAQEKQSGAGALGKMGEKMAGMNPAFGVNPMFGVGMQAANVAMQGLQNSQQSPMASNPYMSARQQNIANAKAAGKFDQIRDDYNQKNASTGMVMDEEGNITRSPEAYARIKQEERDLNRGMWREPQTLSNEEIASGVTSKTAIPSRYGSGSITMRAPGAAKPQSMVRNEFGKMVPMNEYFDRMNYVHGTKGMTGGSSVLPKPTPSKPATKVLPPNPLMKKGEERELFPNAIGERSQYNDWQKQLEEAKQRGAAGMAKYRQGK